VVLCCEHVHSNDFVWLPLVVCTILLYNRIHTNVWKLCANRGTVCTLEKFQWCGEPWVQFKVKVTLPLAVYRQSVRLVKPFETHDERLFFFQRNPCGHRPYVTSSFTRRCVRLLWIILAFRQVYVPHIHHVTEKCSFCTTHKSSVNTVFAKQIIPTLRILCYNGSLVSWTVVSLTTAKFKFRIFSENFKSKSELLYDWRFTANQFVLASSPLRPTTRFFFSAGLLR
jgi:hypothetical protein